MKPIDFSQLIPKDPQAWIQWRRENLELKSVYPEWVTHGVSEQEKFRRFIDLPKLFDLLKNKRLVMPRLEKLIMGDPFECFAKKSFRHLNRVELETRANQLAEYAPDSSLQPFYPPNLSAADALTFRSHKSCFDLEMKDMTDEELRDSVWYLERERLKNDLVCSCWHKGNIESDAMWKIYASQLGVSIGSSVSRMKSSVKMIIPKLYSEQAKINLAAVQYEDNDKCEDVEPWLIKRKAFVHENEVRLYYEVPFVFGSQFELEVEPSTFIEEIVISPFVAEWQVAGIKGAIEALLKEAGAGQIVVRQSKHMSAPQIIWPSPVFPAPIRRARRWRS